MRMDSIGHPAGLACVALVLAAAACGSGHGRAAEAPPGPRFYFPADTILMASFSPARVLDKLGFGPGEFPLSLVAEMEKTAGLKAREIERCTIAIFGGSSDAVYLVRAARDVKPEPIAYALLGNDCVAFETAGMNAWKSREPTHAADALYVLDDRTFVLGPKDGARRWASEPKEPVPSTLKECLRLAGEHDIVLWSTVLSAPYLTEIHTTLDGKPTSAETQAPTRRSSTDAAREKTVIPGVGEVKYLAFYPIPVPAAQEAMRAVVDFEPQTKVQICAFFPDRSTARKHQNFVEMGMDQPRAMLLMMGTMLAVGLGQAEGNSKGPLRFLRALRKGEKAMHLADVRTEGSTVVIAAKDLPSGKEIGASVQEIARLIPKVHELDTRAPTTTLGPARRQPPVAEEEDATQKQADLPAPPERPREPRPPLPPGPLSEELSLVPSNAAVVVIFHPRKLIEKLDLDPKGMLLTELEKKLGIKAIEVERCTLVMAGAGEGPVWMVRTTGAKIAGAVARGLLGAELGDPITPASFPGMKGWQRTSTGKSIALFDERTAILGPVETCLFNKERLKRATLPPSLQEALAMADRRDVVAWSGVDERPTVRLHSKGGDNVHIGLPPEKMSLAGVGPVKFLALYPFYMVPASQQALRLTLDIGKETTFEACAHFGNQDDARKHGEYVEGGLDMPRAMFLMAGYFLAMGDGAEKSALNADRMRSVWTIRQAEKAIHRAVARCDGRTVVLTASGLPGAVELGKCLRDLADTAGKIGLGHPTPQAAPPAPMVAHPNGHEQPLTPTFAPRRETFKFTVANTRKEPALLFTEGEGGKLTFVRRLPGGETMEMESGPQYRWIAIFATTPAGTAFTVTEQGKVVRLR